MAGPGKGLAYIDWSQQEFAIAAVLSGDEAMMNAYRSGDPYLEFAKLAGAIPQNGTKETHPHERSLYKACILGVQYGMGPETLARSINGTPIKGRELIKKHKEAFPDYWKWSEAAVIHALTNMKIKASLGWQLRVSGDINARSLANWPVQTNGAEIMRVAVILAHQHDIQICCPVHDALLIESTIEKLDNDILVTQKAMQEAGEVVLNGFKLRTDVEKFIFPNRYVDPRGVDMWERVVGLLK